MKIVKSDFENRKSKKTLNTTPKDQKKKKIQDHALSAKQKLLHVKMSSLSFVQRAYVQCMPDDRAK